ncbi:MAG: hypothetical protein A3C08_01265 [Candidatus Taylorbacteria bacterium RIFCSPHIGHO2_02_FULL_47_18]|uniref:HEPN AbiU2-like domain-containing protein n=1 Tax=Candidatus Taylorbacteria bacterium RIFCSPLOWO2_01_FULL_48_100 TaxID=1802322 RepID=A0A1G2NEB5_9BACT|nr:MAG: hypothetical protein A2670_01725 [Candidatus Taylorbacteria bacterium RIFCSPHIGHO2_01_FULL_48_38]OHA28389.1 MAG: hypothetical protein A3C08_01265 [Candidatus Taylorbacteria bacterium RIFCSPHIGHO2_02_FULL_47_18]OHA34428.1 MAG: hypothetical protein A2938_01105 [Candidatus Taylorbacteria bacterium RIFCSPLOWO2_01_FULL_48_100]OHA40144.1 MAG: hypothetical protein A3J31_00975 [Candidatus Taylorbacteria bacterium RIFCSPLOWO2_02_FULL_48_16]OHA45521.1 MAG: hypothetical protein A3H13_01870 [Candid
MLNKIDFENIVRDFLFTYRKFLFYAYLHKRVNHDAYEANRITWDTLLISLESDALLGLAKILYDREKSLGRPFNDGSGKTFNNEEFNNEELNEIRKKILNLRHDYLAHQNLSKMRNMDSLLKENRLTGTDGVKMIDALKSRFIQYEKNLKLDVNVQKLFTESQNNALNDLDSWLKSFKTAL